MRHTWRSHELPKKAKGPGGHKEQLIQALGEAALDTMSSVTVMGTELCTLERVTEKIVMLVSVVTAGLSPLAVIFRQPDTGYLPRTGRGMHTAGGSQLTSGLFLQSLCPGKAPA